MRTHNAKCSYERTHAHESKMTNECASREAKPKRVHMSSLRQQSSDRPIREALHTDVHHHESFRSVTQVISNAHRSVPALAARSTRFSAADNPSSFANSVTSCVTCAPTPQAVQQRTETPSAISKGGCDCRARAQCCAHRKGRTWRQRHGAIWEREERLRRYVGA